MIIIVVLSAMDGRRSQAAGCGRKGFNSVFLCRDYGTIRLPGSLLSANRLLSGSENQEVSGHDHKSWEHMPRSHKLEAHAKRPKSSIVNRQPSIGWGFAGNRFLAILLQWYGKSNLHILLCELVKYAG